MDGTKQLPGDYPDPASLPKSEFLTLAGIVAALGLGGGATKTLYEKLQTIDPLLIQVEDSGVSSDSHRIDLKITNHALQAIYIDEIKAEKPKDTTLTIQQRDSSTMTLGSPKDPQKPLALPVRLGSNGAICMTLLLPLGTESSKPHGILDIKYSKLDEKEQKSIKQDFLLRWS
jgi:hypothetical protein